MLISNKALGSMLNIEIFTKRFKSQKFGMLSSKIIFSLYFENIFNCYYIYILLYIHTLQRYD